MLSTQSYKCQMKKRSFISKGLFLRTFSCISFLIRCWLVFQWFALLSLLLLCPIFKKLLHRNYRVILFSSLPLQRQKLKCFKTVNCWTKANGCNIFSNPSLALRSYANTVHSCGSFTVPGERRAESMGGGGVRVKREEAEVKGTVDWLCVNKPSWERKEDAP